MKQEEREVIDYYTEMKFLLQEWECFGDSVGYKKRLENERIFEFLAELNQELDKVRDRILGRKPLHSICEVFSEGEENKRKVMLKPKNFTGHTGTGPKTSALMTKKAPNGSSQNQQKKRP